MVTRGQWLTYCVYADYGNNSAQYSWFSIHSSRIIKKERRGEGEEMEMGIGLREKEETGERREGEGD